jgi:hypothetical protein
LFTVVELLRVSVDVAAVVWGVRPNGSGGFFTERL